MLFFDPFTSTTTRTGRTHDYEVVRDDSAVTVRFDVPGVARDAIDLEVEGRTLTVTADRPATRGEGDTLLAGGLHRRALRRSFRVSPDLDLEGTAADVVDGVLTITVPLAEAATSRRIEIGDGSAAALAEAA